jgi:Gluconate 2-dehydrogenase subunit 3
MNRRSSLKTLFIISAGAALLPSCVQETNRSSTAYSNLKISSDDEALMAALSETIIPTTDTPGAKEVGASQFALMMVNDCYPPDAQDKFLKGMKGFEDLCEKKFNQSFVHCSAANKTALLTSIQNNHNVPEDVVFFYNTTKGLTIEAFTQSKYYLTKVHVYVLVPGKFYGCVPVKKAS